MENNEKEKNDQLDDTIELGVARIKNSRGNFHCITIIGQIEGHTSLNPQVKTTKYEHIIPELVSIEENDDIDGLLIILNTVGGDVEAGLAISEMIASMKKPTVSLVLGGGHSIGIPLAVSSDYSFIAPSATMTVHPVRISGTVIGSSQTFSYFEKMQERIVSFVCANSNISEKDFTSLMMKVGEISNDVGSVLYGKDAVNYGLIDSVGGISDAMDKLYKLKKKSKKSDA